MYPAWKLKSWILGHGDILVLADVFPPPLPPNEKVGFQVKVTFWFWQMYPSQNEKVEFWVKVTF